GFYNKTGDHKRPQEEKISPNHDGGKADSEEGKADNEQGKADHKQGMFSVSNKVKNQNRIRKKELEMCVISIKNTQDSTVFEITNADEENEGDTSQDDKYHEADYCALSIKSVEAINYSRLNVLDVAQTWRYKYKTAIEVERFKIEFEEKTGTKWLVQDKKPSKDKEMKNYVLVWKFFCHHNGKRRTPEEKRRKKCKTIAEERRCPAKMEFIIKKDLDCHCNDPFMPEKPFEFTLRGRHNHDLNQAGPCKHLPPLEETLNTLYTFFMNNDRPGVASHKLNSQIILSEEPSERIQDTRYLPDIRQIYHLWDKWANEAFGKDWPSALESIKRDYPSQSHVRVCEELHVVAIVTDLMERVHKSNPLCKDIVFIDTTSNVDLYHTSVTFILTSSPIGAMPLGVILSDGQDEKSYTKGFAMIKDIVSDYGFYGQKFPAVIMTDDGTAERNALRKIFPTSILLLCIFHFLQAFWRWLLNSKHGVAMEDRQEIMVNFKIIVYCQNAEDLDTAKEALENLESFKNNESLKKHYNDMLQRIEVWCIAYRVEYLTRGYDTNNFSEATMRVFKELFLERCRLYNAAQLVAYIIKEYECYHTERIRDFLSHSQSVKIFRDGTEKLHIGSKYLPKNQVKENAIKKIENGRYSIKSQRRPEVIYEVTTHNCMCSCPAVISGVTCKHLLGVHLHTDAVLFILPPTSLEEMNKYHYIAFGKLPEIDRYASHINKVQSGSESVLAGVKLSQQADMNIDKINEELMEIEEEDMTNNMDISK
ncbi:unnamed protein product, partial [Meganyctiphanes norvegica]